MTALFAKRVRESEKAQHMRLNPWAFPCRRMKTTEFLIGPPLLVTFQERYGADPQTAEELVKKYRERYTNIGVYESEPYDGIEQLLQALKTGWLKK